MVSNSSRCGVSVFQVWFLILPGVVCLSSRCGFCVFLVWCVCLPRLVFLPFWLGVVFLNDVCFPGVVCVCMCVCVCVRVCLCECSVWSGIRFFSMYLIIYLLILSLLMY